MTVIACDFRTKRVTGRFETGEATIERKDDRVRRITLERCQRVGGIPGEIAHYYANQAAQIARTNPARETSSLVEQAVRRAIDAANARNPDPTRPFAA